MAGTVLRARPGYSPLAIVPGKLVLCGAEYATLYFIRRIFIRPLHTGSIMRSACSAQTAWTWVWPVVISGAV